MSRARSALSLNAPGAQPCQLSQFGVGNCMLDHSVEHLEDVALSLNGGQQEPIVLVVGSCEMASIAARMAFWMAWDDGNLEDTVGILLVGINETIHRDCHALHVFDLIGKGQQHISQVRGFRWWHWFVLRGPGDHPVA